MNLNQLHKLGMIDAYGTSEGAKKGWDTRGRSSNQHYSVSDSHDVGEHMSQMGFKEKKSSAHDTGPYSDYTSTHYTHPSGASVTHYYHSDMPFNRMTVRGPQGLHNTLKQNGVITRKTNADPMDTIKRNERK